MSYGFLTFRDASGEKAGVSLNLETILADGTNLPSVVSDWAALKAAVDGVQVGELFEEAVVYNRSRVSNLTPATGDRELKWLVRYEDDTTKKVYTFEIPNASRSALPMQPSSDFVDLGGNTAALNALIAAVNTNLRSPTGGDCTLISIQIVGRNL